LKRFVLDNLAVASIEAPKQKDRDLLYIMFKLCHEGPNANHDYFTSDVLKNAYATCINKPINWEHGKVCFGFIDKSELAKEDDGKYYIKCGGYVWQYNFPTIAREITDGFADGTLKVSMECWFREAEYWVGDGEDKVVLAEDEARDLGLLNNNDQLVRSYEGKPVYRVFKDVLFGGAALTRNPADVQAVLLAVAENQNSFNPVKIYHDALHKAYELNLFNSLTSEEVVAEHKRLHQQFAKFLEKGGN
jgi:hypothetical protein